MKESKFKQGEIVMERVRPYLKLLVSRYENQIYYCKILDRESKKELVYSERELMSCLAK